MISSPYPGDFLLFTELFFRGPILRNVSHLCQSFRVMIEQGINQFLLINDDGHRHGIVQGFVLKKVSEVFKGSMRKGLFIFLLADISIPQFTCFRVFSDRFRFIRCFLCFLWLCCFFGDLNGPSLSSSAALEKSRPRSEAFIRFFLSSDSMIRPFPRFLADEHG